MTRSVVITANTILELFKDYLGPENIPAGAKVTGLLYNRAERGRLALKVAAEDWPKTASGDGLSVKFDLRRTWLAG